MGAVSEEKAVQRNETLATKVIKETVDDFTRLPLLFDFESSADEMRQMVGTRENEMEEETAEGEGKDASEGEGEVTAEGRDKGELDGGGMTECELTESDCHHLPQAIVHFCV